LNQFFEHDAKARSNLILCAQNNKMAYSRQECSQKNILGGANYSICLVKAGNQQSPKFLLKR